MLALPFEDGLALYFKAKEKTLEDRLHREWAACLPVMDKDSFISFADYKAWATGANIDMRPTDELVSELEEIERTLARQKGDRLHGA